MTILECIEELAAKEASRRHQQQVWETASNIAYEMKKTIEEYEPTPDNQAR
jgi:hypothetical protein